jgi:hypothetical protein
MAVSHPKDTYMRDEDMKGESGKLGDEALHKTIS